MHTSRKISFLVWFFTLFLINSGLLAQENEKTFRIKNNALSIVPQYAFSNGIRFDYERRLGKGEVWLLAANQVYIDNTPYDSYYYYYSFSSPWLYYDFMRGAGMNVYIKWNATKSDKVDRISGKPARLFYIAGGPSYQYFELNRYEEITVPYQEDGITYYKFENQKTKFPIHRFGAHFNMGMQFSMDPFFFDIYVGVGGKISKNTEGETVGLNDAGWIDPAYSGLFLDGGFKFGVYF